MKNEIISAKLAWLNLILSIFIVCLHSDCSFATNDILILRIYKWMSTLFDIAVPLFFFMSAFWFYLGLDDVEEQFAFKILKRVKTLIIPYLCFSAIFILLNTAMSFSSVLKQYSVYSFINMDWKITLKIWLLTKCNPATWFVRPLFILQFFSLPFYLFIKRKKFIGPLLFLSVVILNCLIRPGYSEALFWLPMFILGVTSATFYNEICSMLEMIRSKKIICYSIVIIFLFFVSFVFDKNNFVFYYLYRNFGSLFFMGAFLLSRDIYHKPCMNRYSFFLFMMHYPIVYFVKQFILDKIYVINGSVIFGVYLTVISLTILFIMLTYEVLRKKCPVVWNVLNGNRKI